MSEADRGEAGLARRLGLFDATMIVIGGIGVVILIAGVPV